MLKKLMIASAVSAAVATSFAYAQQNSQSASKQNGTDSQSTGQKNEGALKRNQDAPSGGVGQVFPSNAQTGNSSGASGNAGASGGMNQDVPSGGVGQVFPSNAQTGNSAGSSGSGNQAGSAGASSGQGEDKPKDGGKSQTVGKAPVYLLVPVDVAAKDNSMKNGCWAKIYSRENYLGDSLTVVGPSALPNMDQSGLFGLNWDDRVNSIELGPKATMTVFDNENFRDIVGQFKPGQKVPDIDTKTGFFEEFASVKIDCQRG